MKYIIGIDGGGTKTDCAVADLEGSILFETKGEPSNFLNEGIERVSESILDLINKCRKKIGFEYSDIELILLGTAGAGRTSDAEGLQNSFKNYSKIKGINFKKFLVESDAKIALEGAFSGKPGAILIAGTGSIIIGKNDKGYIHRAGGFGRKIGDEGSGYCLGRRGLNAVSKYFDGRGNSTIIYNLLKENFHIDSPETLINQIYKNNFNIASIAPLVITAAENSDDTALKIINEETDELLLHVSSIQQKLSMTHFNLSFSGSLIDKDNFYSRHLKGKIIKRLPEINIQPPDNPPVVGAILTAKEIIGKK